MVEDEWDFCKKLGKTECLKQLSKHWGEWFTEQGPPPCARPRVAANVAQGAVPTRPIHSADMKRSKGPA